MLDDGSNLISPSLPLPLPSPAPCSGVELVRHGPEDTPSHRLRGITAGRQSSGQHASAKAERGPHRTACQTGTILIVAVVFDICRVSPVVSMLAPRQKKERIERLAGQVPTLV